MYTGRREGPGWASRGWVEPSWTPPSTCSNGAAVPLPSATYPDRILRAPWIPGIWEAYAGNAVGGCAFGPQLLDIRIFMHIRCACTPEQGGGMLFARHLQGTSPRCRNPAHIGIWKRTVAIATMSSKKKADKKAKAKEKKADKENKDKKEKK